MNNDMLYTMFANTLSKMDDVELNKSLQKAKEVLSAKDYEYLLEFVKKEREKNINKT